MYSSILFNLVFLVMLFKKLTKGDVPFGKFFVFFF